MEIKILKWGNSHAVRIPLSFLNHLGIKENDSMIMEINEQNIILSKPKHKTIEERIKNYKDDYKCEEFVVHDVKGHEIW